MATVMAIVMPPCPLAQPAHREAQHLLLVEIQRVEEVPESGDQRRAGRSQRVELTVEELLGFLAAEVVGVDQAGDLGTARQRLERAAGRAQLLQQQPEQRVLALAQVQKGTGPGLQPVAAVAVGIGSQAPAEAAPPITAVVTMATVAAVATVSSVAAMTVCVAASEATPAPWETTEAAEAMPGAVDGQRAVVAVVTHRADRTEATIVAEKSVLTFMVVAPASKQMHGAIPR